VKARAQIVAAGRISDAERLWYDTSRWASFIDGFHHVASVDPEWPASGTLTWDTHHGGRGRVLEIVERYEARVGQTSSVEDATTVGTQAIGFEALPDEHVRITLELSWQLKQRGIGPIQWVVDGLFIRPRQREALVRTLGRFRRELAVELEPDRLVDQ